MGKKLSNILAPIVLGIPLAIGGINSGCATEGGYTRGAGLIMSENRDPLVRALGKVLFYKGDYDDRMDIAKAGKDEINIYKDENYSNRNYRSNAIEDPSLFHTRKENKITKIFHPGEAMQNYVYFGKILNSSRINIPLAIRCTHLDSGEYVINEYEEERLNKIYIPGDPKPIRYTFDIPYNVLLGEYENTLIGDIDRDGKWEEILKTRLLIIE
jgi:hypothetical protein